MKRILGVLFAVAAMLTLVGCNRDCDDDCTYNTPADHSAILGCTECVPAPAPLVNTPAPAPVKPQVVQPQPKPKPAPKPAPAPVVAQTQPAASAAECQRCLERARAQATYSPPSFYQHNYYGGAESVAAEDHKN